jgi:adenylate cyclase
MLGDAVMAVFGVPFASDMDAIHACNTALKMRDALAITNRDRAEKGKITIKMGIGVNTGMVSMIDVRYCPGILVP